MVASWALCSVAALGAEIMDIKLKEFYIRLTIFLVMVGCIFVEGGTAEANQRVHCVTESCESILCIRDDYGASKACLESCARESLESVSPGSNCTISWPREEVPPPPPTPPWAGQIKACVSRPNDQEIPSLLTSSPNIAVGRQYTFQSVVVPIGYKVTDIYCKVLDGPEEGWCADGFGSGTRCSIGYSWAQYMKSYYLQDGRPIVEVYFYNESHNRMRAFKIFVKTIPE